jgi:outer membrane biosynthesis protein TonB
MQSKENHLLFNSQDLGYTFNPKANSHYGDKHLSVNISRNTLIAYLISIIIHGLIFFVVPKITFDEPANVSARAIEVTLAPIRIPTKIEVPQPKAVPPQPPPTVTSAVKTSKPKSTQPNIIANKPQNTKQPLFEVPEVEKQKTELDKRPPKDQPIKEPPVEQQYTDMAAYVRAQQAKRVDAEAVAAKINAEAAAKERGPTEAQIRDERIKRNLKHGTNGIFEITSLGARNATFSFRGWTDDYSNAKRQFFEVESSGGQDVRLLMVRLMILLIREHYDGDFNWESYRLGRSVVLSAKPEESAGLEDFLMKEFFGNNYKTQY